MFNVQITSKVPASFVKFFAPADVEAFLSHLNSLEGIKCVVFIDTPTTADMKSVVEEILKRGLKVVVRDHHEIEGAPKNPREEEIRAACDALRALEDERLSVKIVTRKEHPACIRLLSLGEFADEHTLMVLDPDADGLMAGLYAVGICYEGMVQDAEVLDGPRSAQTEDRLTATGMLLKQGFSTLPEFDKDRPQIFENAKGKLFSEFAKAAAGDEEATEGLKKNVAAYEASVTEAQRLIGTMTVPFPGLVSVDVREAQKYDLTTLTNAMEASEGAKMTLVVKKDGPIGKIFGGQFSLAVIKKFQEEYNLLNLIPQDHPKGPEAGLISNVPFMAHYSEEVWREKIEPQVRELLKPVEKKDPEQE